MSGAMRGSIVAWSARSADSFMGIRAGTYKDESANRTGLIPQSADRRVRQGQYS